jgi:hypothetical protein
VNKHLFFPPHPVHTVPPLSTSAKKKKKKEVEREKRASDERSDKDHGANHQHVPSSKELMAIKENSKK